jgi:adenosylcobinamide kinase/adenosylcobinamide-phosphate guanylyltransferase
MPTALPAALPPLTLILGGARSGKSRHGEQLAIASGLNPVYLATAEAGDEEMSARIKAHRARREALWATVEEPLALAETLRRTAGPDRVILVDCLTLWLTNLMVAERDVAEEIETLLAALPDLPGRILLVSNEVGQGVVPINAMARGFVDHAGILHQRLAEQAGRVVFMTAGIAMDLKPWP